LAQAPARELRSGHRSHFGSRCRVGCLLLRGVAMQFSGTQWCWSSGLQPGLIVPPAGPLGAPQQWRTLGLSMRHGSAQVLGSSLQLCELEAADGPVVGSGCASHGLGEALRGVQWARCALGLRWRNSLRSEGRRGVWVFSYGKSSCF
jgi:hypothetical protein